MTVAPCRPTTLSPAALLACSMALATPSVTNVYTVGCDVGRLVVGDHEARGIADRSAVAPTAVALVLVERRAAHHDRADAVEHLLQDGPVVVGRRVEYPVVQHAGSIAERVLAAVIRAGDVPVERHGHIADHACHG